MRRVKAFAMIECLVSLSVLSVLCASVCYGSRNVYSFLRSQKACHEDYIRAAEADKKIRLIADGICRPFWEQKTEIVFNENVLSVEWFEGCKEKTDFIFDSGIIFLSAELEENNGISLLKMHFASGVHDFETVVSMH